MKNAIGFYEFGCNYFTVRGEPDMRNQDNKRDFGPEGFDFKEFSKRAVKKQLDLLNKK